MLTFCYFIAIYSTFCIQIKDIPPQVQQEVHYSSVVSRATEMITRYEGLSLTAYKDTRWYSIWYWTRSYEGEVITEREAWNRMEGRVSDSIQRIQRDFPNASEDELVALTSLYYNCWSGWLKVKKVWFSAWDDPKFCTKAWYSWLEKRRNEERMLIWFGQE